MDLCRVGAGAGAEPRWGDLDDRRRHARRCAVGADHPCGSVLGGFYRTQRIVDGDAFYVAVRALLDVR